MSTYNEPLEWLEDSIGSVLSQTYSYFEFIIVCDNPHNTILREFLIDKAKSDKRIKIIFNDVNKGLTKSLNIAFAQSRGEYVARIDGDDVCEISRFQKQVTFLDSNPNISICHTNCFIFKNSIKQARVRYNNDSEADVSWFSWCNPIAHSSVMFRSSLKGIRNPLYNEHYKSAQDYELWTFMANHNVEFGYLSIPLVYYRISDAQISSSKNSKQKENAIQIRRKYILEKLKKEGIIQSADISLVCAFNAVKQHETQFEKDELRRLLYLFYFTLAKTNIIYVFRYFADHNRLWSYFDYKYSLYVLFNPLVKNKWQMFSL